MLFFYASCTKDVAVIPPPPSPYVGSFIFTTKYRTWQWSQPSFDTVVVYNGTVSLNPQGKFLINYRSNRNSIVEINSNGSFVPQTYIHGGLNGGYSGYNNFSFVYSDGSLGAGERDSVSAVRH